MPMSLQHRITKRIMQLPFTSKPLAHGIHPLQYRESRLFTPLNVNQRDSRSAWEEYFGNSRRLVLSVLAAR